MPKPSAYPHPSPHRPSRCAALKCSTASSCRNWSGTFSRRPATLLFLPNDNAIDPWFVRAEGYPGVGLALAWDRPVTTTREAPLARSVTILIADGALTPDAVSTLAAEERHP